MYKETVITMGGGFPSLEMEMLEPKETTEDSGCVNYYYLNDDGKSWEQLDQNIDSDTLTDHSGFYVLSRRMGQLSRLNSICRYTYVLGLIINVLF